MSDTTTAPAPKVEAESYSTCGNCCWRGPTSEADEIADLWSRVEPGDEMPSGECPECGALVHLEKPEGVREFGGGVAQTYADLHDGLSDMIEGGRLSAEEIPDDYRWLVESLASLANKEPEVPRAVRICFDLADLLRERELEFKGTDPKLADLYRRAENFKTEARTLKAPKTKPAMSEGTGRATEGQST